eukprot:CAMPEP_0170616260 /NCGR_PEP_ID=MMETSP0224-20130122/25776_1 /TAXON_ID=285029 /ORGANISM="Togula jolla, Strain CCCM 725" /LENGTH=60 /DNA_ID=CAMNT_0010942047 /DNA_START=219 /DNA_END=402 /DNA_ORIENTATION=+
MRVQHAHCVVPIPSMAPTSIARLLLDQEEAMQRVVGATASEGLGETWCLRANSPHPADEL